MKTNEAKGNVIKLLTKNGYSVNDMVVTVPVDENPEIAINLRNEMSDIIFTNSDGNEAFYQIASIGSVLKLVECEC